MTKAAELAKMGEVLTNSQIGGRRNIVINGAMQIAQRGTSQTGITASANEGYTTVDRFAFDGGTHGGAFTASQSTDAPTGFSNSLKMDCTTADTSIAAGEYLMLQTRFEGQDVQQLKKGTSSAEKVTVSFYVKANASATYICELQDNDNARTNGQTFAVTTDWTRVVLTFVGDTTGTLDNDNNLSLRLNFWFHGGSTFTGGTFTSNQWTGTANERVGSITSFFDSTDRTFFITGIQMEIGEVATPFEFRSFGEELALCQRYYERYETSGANYARFGLFQCTGTTAAFGAIDYKVSKRSASVTLDTELTRLALSDSDNSILPVTAIGVDSNCNSFENASLSISASGGGLVAGECTQLFSENVNNGYIAIDAEL